MALRTPQTIRYNLELTEINKRISYRALTVGEQKTLLMAIELKEPHAIVNTLADIVRAVTFGEIDLNTTPMHLVDYIFLNSFIRSSGAKSKAEYTCGGVVDVVEDVEVDGVVTPTEVTRPCNTKSILLLDLDKAYIKYPETYAATKLIDVGDGMSINLRLPDFQGFKSLDASKDIIGISDQYIFAGIEYILDGDDMKTPGIDYTMPEMVEWLNGLPAPVLEEIAEFFKNVPQLTLDVNVTCPKCGRKDGFELTGLEDFFQ